MAIATIDFETGDFTQCSSEVIGSGDALVVNAASKIHGNYGMQLTAGGNSVSTYIEKIYSTATSIYFRFYMTLGTVFTSSNEPGYMEFAGLHLTNGDPSIILGITNDYSPYRILLIAYYDNTSDYKPVEIDLSPGTHCYEIYATFGSGTGSLTVWQDFCKVCLVTGITNNQKQPDRIRLGGLPINGCYYETSSIVGFDDIVIDSSYIGAYGLTRKEFFGDSFSVNDSSRKGRVTFGDASARKYVSSSFVASSSYSVACIAVMLFTNRTSNSIVHCYLYSDSSGKPGSLLATATNTVDLTYIPNRLNNSNLIFNFSGYSIVNTTKYHVVIMIDNVGASYSMYADYGTSTNNICSSSNGSSWSSVDTGEFGLQVYSNNSASNNFLKQGYWFDQSGVSGASIYN